jgi:hypothetical protein
MAIQQPLSQAGAETNVREDAEIQVKVADKIIERFEGDHQSVGEPRENRGAARNGAGGAFEMGGKGKARFP